MKQVEIEILYHGYYEKITGLELNKKYNGILQGYFQEGNINDGIDLIAIIELENGKIYKCCNFINILLKQEESKK
jgi:hypothetical protein